MNQGMRINIKISAIAMAVILMSACTAVNHKVGSVLNLDTNLKLNITATGDINPDERAQASPVFIRLYELSSTKAFEQADFIDLFERDQEVLGDSFLAKQELARVVPGTQREERFVLSKDTRYVALFAEFFRYKDSRAKVVFPVTSSNVVRNMIEIRVSGNSVTLVEK